jgi:hypothetical protein
MDTLFTPTEAAGARLLRLFGGGDDTSKGGGHTLSYREKGVQPSAALQRVNHHPARQQLIAAGGRVQRRRGCGRGVTGRSSHSGRHSGGGGRLSRGATPRLGLGARRGLLQRLFWRGKTERPTSDETQRTGIARAHVVCCHHVAARALACVCVCAGGSARALAERSASSPSAAGACCASALSASASAASPASGALHDSAAALRRQMQPGVSAQRAGATRAGKQGAQHARARRKQVVLVRHFSCVAPKVNEPRTSAQVCHGAQR